MCLLPNLFKGIFQADFEDQYFFYRQKLLLDHCINDASHFFT